MDQRIQIELPIEIYERFRKWQEHRQIQPPIPAQIVQMSNPMTSRCKLYSRQDSRPIGSIVTSGQEIQQPANRLTTYAQGQETVSQETTSTTNSQETTSTSEESINNNNTSEQSSTIGLLPPLQLPAIIVADYKKKKFEATLLYIDDESGSRYTSKHRTDNRCSRNAVFIRIDQVPETDNHEYDHLKGQLFCTPSAACHSFQIQKNASSNTESGWNAFRVKSSNELLGAYRLHRSDKNLSIIGSSSQPSRVKRINRGHGFINPVGATLMHRDILAWQTRQFNPDAEIQYLQSMPECLQSPHGFSIEDVYKHLEQTQPQIDPMTSGQEDPQDLLTSSNSWTPPILNPNMLGLSEESDDTNDINDLPTFDYY